jgi:hypothetical protein
LTRPCPEIKAATPLKLHHAVGHDHDRTRNASTPRLARLLWRLLDSAGCNLIAPLGMGYEWSIREEFAALGRAACKIEIAPGVELARAFWTHARPLETKTVYGTLRAMAPKWPKTHAPQGFVALYAKAIKGNEIHVPDGEPVIIATRVQSPSIRGNHISGPYIILVVAGEYPEARGYAPLRAYAQPIYNGRMFVPVESDFERKALRAILDTQRVLHAQGVDMAISKPLFDSMTPNGPCRPDFILEARSRMTGELRTVVVEAMGFDSDEYEAAKAVTHPRMAVLGDLVTLDRFEIDQDSASTKLLRVLDI